MKRTPILIIALASTFALSAAGAYAQEDEKKEPKKPYVVSQSDETKKPEQSDEKKDKKKPADLTAQSDEPKKPKPELAS